MRFKNTLGYMLAGALLAGGMSVAVAAQKAPADIIKERQEMMKGLGADLKTISDQLKTNAPDKAAIAKAFKHAADSGKNVAELFPAGTGPESGIKTDAKAEIWTMSADFKAAAANFVTVSAKSADAAAKADVEGLNAEAKALGSACGGCHKPFRVPPPPAAK